MNGLIRDLQSDIQHRRDYSLSMVAKFEEDAIVDENGIVKWKMGNFVPEDIMGLWHIVGKVFNYEASMKAKEASDSEFFANYRNRMANHEPDGEELFEMEAAFGKGTTVVNCITGKKTRL